MEQKHWWDDKREEIISGSKLIGNFLGWKFDEVSNCFIWQEGTLELSADIYFSHKMPVGFLSFHHSWNWLMPLMEIIEKQGCIIEICKSLGSSCRICRINGKDGKVKNIIIEGNNLQEVTWKAAVEFIQYIEPTDIKPNLPLLTHNS